jgi:hypothetical protein
LFFFLFQVMGQRESACREYPTYTAKRWYTIQASQKACIWLWFILNNPVGRKSGQLGYDVNIYVTRALPVTRPTVYLAHLGLKDHILNMPLLSIHRHQVYWFILNLIWYKWKISRKMVWVFFLSNYCYFYIGFSQPIT